MISVRVLDDHINTRINYIQYHLTKGLIIFWNLELKMDKGHLYYLFFYCFNLFTITFLASLYYIDVLFFLAVFKMNRKIWLFGAFFIISQKLQVLLNFWSIIWKPDKIPLPVIGVICTYCKNWLSNGHFCGGKVFFLHPLDKILVTDSFNFCTIIPKF